MAGRAVTTPKGTSVNEIDLHMNGREEEGGHKNTYGGPSSQGPTGEVLRRRKNIT